MSIRDLLGGIFAACVAIATLPAIAADCDNDTRNAIKGENVGTGVRTYLDNRTAQRLSLTRNGQIRYQLKIPYNDGTTHVIFDPLDFIARLVALVPKPRVNLTRYHGIFAPHSQYRTLVTPAMGGQQKVRIGR